MIPLYDLHTHCTCCDGKDTPEQMVCAAIKKGMRCIGFSSHSFTAFDTSYCMAEGVSPQYKAEILRLREKYKEQIQILLGCEQDYDSDADTAGYDYVIGSVHYLHCGEEYLPVDLSASVLADGVRRCYSGDFYAAAAAYYKAVADVQNKTGCDIIGHFDLIAKFNEGNAWFEETDMRYISAALTAADALLNTGAFFEINTGAITRGHRTVPYPAPFILRYIVQKKGRIVLSGDTHAAQNLCNGWKTAVEYVRCCGCTAVYAPTACGFKEFALK